MILENHNPRDLKPNPWNSNRLSPEAETRLEASLIRFDGLFKPIIVRTLANGTLQVIGGQHRNEAAERLGHTSIPVINLGLIDDVKAKEISLIDNGRYGHDDSTQLAKILSELGSSSELATFMPFDMADIDSILSTTSIDLDAIDLGLDDTDEVATEKPPRVAKTHTIMRQKIPVEDQPLVEMAFKRIIQDQGLSDSDSLVNAGDALIWLIRNWIESEKV
jgi:ParB family chromosome partitioning protein